MSLVVQRCGMLFKRSRCEVERSKDQFTRLAVDCGMICITLDVFYPGDFVLTRAK